MSENRVLTREEREKYFPDLIVFRRLKEPSQETIPAGSYYRYAFGEDSPERHTDSFKDRAGMHRVNRDIELKPWAIGAVYERVDINFVPEDEIQEEPEYFAPEPEGPRHKVFIQGPCIDGYSYTGEFRRASGGEEFLSNSGKLDSRGVGSGNNKVFILEPTKPRNPDICVFEFDLTKILRESDLEEFEISDDARICQNDNLEDLLLSNSGTVITRLALAKDFRLNLQRRKDIPVPE